MSFRSRVFSRTWLALSCVLIAVIAAGGSRAAAADVRTITLLSISDWHGQLEPVMVPIDGTRRAVGGAPVLKAWLDRERARNPNGTLTVMAGDSFGGTPPVSAFLEDVPAVEVQNALGVDADTLGNHNFDHGLSRLRKLVAVARFPYLSANVMTPDGWPLVPATHTIVRNGVRVGLIGITNPEAPTLISAGATGDYRFGDPAPIINARAAELRQAGAQIVVVLAHIGAVAVARDGAPVGPLIDLARAVRGVDVLIGDHTDVAVNVVIGDMLVVENRSRGVQYSVIEVTYDVAGGKVVGRVATQRQPFADGVTPDPALQKQIDGYRTRVRPFFDRKLGTAASVIANAGAAESPLGSLIADTLRDAYRADIAFINWGAVRDNLPSSYRPDDRALHRPGSDYQPGPPWDVVAGDVLAALPFGNVAVTFRITGRALWAALERSVSGGTVVDGKFAHGDGRFFHVSGFRFRFAPARPRGQRVTDVTLADGRAVARDEREYSAVTNEFLYDGGDGQSLNNGTGVTRVPVTETVSELLANRSPLAPPAAGRVAIEPN